LLRDESKKKLTRDTDGLKKIEGRCLTWIEKARYHTENPIYAEERDVSQ
jgi:hypothetical protein